MNTNNNYKSISVSQRIAQYEQYEQKVRQMPNSIRGNSITHTSSSISKTKEAASKTETVQALVAPALRQSDEKQLIATGLNKEFFRFEDKYQFEIIRSSHDLFKINSLTDIITSYFTEFDYHCN